MTKLQRHALNRALENAKSPSVPAGGYTADFKPIKYEQLVTGVRNVDLLNDPVFKAGWQRCYQELVSMVNWILSEHTSKEDLIKYAGKPKK